MHLEPGVWIGERSKGGKANSEAGLEGARTRYLRALGLGAG